MNENFKNASNQAAMSGGIQLKESEERGLASNEAAKESAEAIAEDTRSAVDDLNDVGKAVMDGFAQVPPESPATPEVKLIYHGLDLETHIIHVNDDTPVPIPMLSEEDDGNPVLTERNISLVYGAEKSRKTTLGVWLVNVMLGGKSGGFLAAREDYKVLLADTEQSVNYLAREARKIYRMMGWNEKEGNPRLVVSHLLDPTDGLDLKGDEDKSKMEPEHKMRLHALEDLMERHQPNCVFLDGAVDLCPDFNDIPKCQMFVTSLRKLAERYNCHIISVLHTNKDGKTERGTLGSTHKQKGETAFFVTKIDENCSKVSPVSCRQKPFKPFYIGIDEDGLPYRLDKDEEKKAKKKEGVQARMTKLLRAVFAENNGMPMQRGELARAMSRMSDKVLGSNLAYETAKGHVDNARKIWGIIEKTDSGEYLFKDPEDDLQQNLDFEDGDDEE